MVKRQHRILPEVLWQPNVSVRGALRILVPQHEVSVPASTGDKSSSLRDCNRMNFVGVAAEHPGFGPGFRVPEADGLIGRCGNQLPSVLRERQLGNPTGMSIKWWDNKPT